MHFVMLIWWTKEIFNSKTNRRYYTYPEVIIHISRKHVYRFIENVLNLLGSYGISYLLLVERWFYWFFAEGIKSCQNVLCKFGINDIHCKKNCNL